MQWRQDLGEQKDCIGNSREGATDVREDGRQVSSGLERIFSKPLTATPKSSSENKNGALLLHKTGGDSTSVISRVGPYWSAWLELARSPDLFAQAKPCQKSGETLWKRGDVASIGAMPFRRAKLDLPASWASEPDLSNSGGESVPTGVPVISAKKHTHTHTGALELPPAVKSDFETTILACYS